jgi:hypothetical protein
MKDERTTDEHVRVVKVKEAKRHPQLLLCSCHTVSQAHTTPIPSRRSVMDWLRAAGKIAKMTHLLVHAVEGSHRSLRPFPYRLLPVGSTTEEAAEGDRTAAVHRMGTAAAERDSLLVGGIWKVRQRGKGCQHGCHGKTMFEGEIWAYCCWFILECESRRAGRRGRRKLDVGIKEVGFLAARARQEIAQKSSGTEASYTT